MGFAVAFAAAGQAGVARHRAQTAADAGALAAASRVLLGEAEACSAAASFVAANGARLEECEVDGLEVTVRTTVPVPGIPAAFGPARAVSRAGPVTAA
jgi:secretion/DNA translocation related TadE-like protein